jgi:hypothetical protein
MAKYMRQQPVQFAGTCCKQFQFQFQYQEFPARTQLFTRLSLENPAQQEVIAPAPWHVQLWLIDADCAFYDSTSPTTSNQPDSVPVPPGISEQSIATLRQFSSPATTLLTNLTEASPLIRTELTVKTPDGGHHISGLVDCAATLDFVSEDFVRRNDILLYRLGSL